jgi:hypothetical protein
MLPHAKAGSALISAVQATPAAMTAQSAKAAKILFMMVS